MIYTLTLNPAIDYVMYLEEIVTGKVNRSHRECLFVGGKGINVSRILKELETPSTVLGFCGGFTGQLIEETLKNDGILTDFVCLEDGFSRINVKVKGKNETELNADGPTITRTMMEKLFKKLDNLTDKDILVLGGSVPKSVDNNIYQQIIKKVEKNSVKTIVDAEKTLLLDCLRYKPFLIKPNHKELGEILNREISSLKDAEKGALELIEMGAENVIVSMAEMGAVLVTKKGEKYYCPASMGQVKNSVGAGDSMVAGFLTGHLENRGLEYALRLGVAAGSATAFSDDLAKKEDILKLLKA